MEDAVAVRTCCCAICCHLVQRLTGIKTDGCHECISERTKVFLKRRPCSRTTLLAWPSVVAAADLASECGRDRLLVVVQGATSGTTQKRAGAEDAACVTAGLIVGNATTRLDIAL